MSEKENNKSIEKTEGFSVKDAENLVKEYKSTDDEEKLFDAIKIYTNKCSSKNSTDKELYESMVSFIEYIPEEGYDMLIRWRDMIKFLKGDEKEKKIKLLAHLSKSQILSSYQRILNVVCIYNNLYIEFCYDCFRDLALDPVLLVKYKVEAARYLFGSDIEENREIAQDTLLEIIENIDYDDTFRYKVLAGFITKTGLSTYLNNKVLRIIYDEEFVYGLQKCFFHNENNDIRYRILSGQHMLSMKRVKEKEEEFREIENVILDVAKDPNNNENTRADAADVIYRCGFDEESRTKAREIIAMLGFSEEESREKTMIGRAKTAYSNSQNVHNEAISKSLNAAIEKLISESNIKMLSYSDVHAAVSNLIQARIIDKIEKLAAFKSLNRISVDTAVFSKYRATTAEIFTHVWSRIQKHENKEELETRLVQELIEMSDTCSSGHSSRLINVFDDVVKISWDDQILANVVGRLNALIRDSEEDLLIGMMDDADEEDRILYVTFVKENLEKLEKELYKEFVSDGYIKTDKYNESFSLAKRHIENEFL